VSPRSFFKHADDYADAYTVAKATDEQFDEAITEAKAEGNLSRANVVRKVKAEKPRPTGRPEILRKTRRIDSNRVIEATVNAANPDAGGVLAEVDFAALDHERLETWISSLSSHIRGLRSLRSQLEKELNRRVSA
jgi:hypothetical protein